MKERDSAEAPDLRMPNLIPLNFLASSVCTSLLRKARFTFLLEIRSVRISLAIASLLGCACWLTGIYLLVSDYEGTRPLVGILDGHAMTLWSTVLAYVALRGMWVFRPVSRVQWEHLERASKKSPLVARAVQEKKEHLRSIDVEVLLGLGDSANFARVVEAAATVAAEAG